MESILSEAIRDPQRTGTEHFRFRKTKGKKKSLYSCVTVGLILVVDLCAQDMCSTSSV